MKAPTPYPMPNGSVVSPPKATQVPLKVIPTPGAPGFANKAKSPTGEENETARISAKLLARLSKNDLRPRR